MDGQLKQAMKRKIDYFLYDTLHAKRSLKYCPILSGKTLRSFIHPELPDFYVGFRWFTGQIVHFFGRQMNRWPIIVLAFTGIFCMVIQS